MSARHVAIVGLLAGVVAAVYLTLRPGQAAALPVATAAPGGGAVDPFYSWAYDVPVMQEADYSVNPGGLDGELGDTAANYAASIPGPAPGGIAAALDSVFSAATGAALTLVGFVMGDRWQAAAADPKNAAYVAAAHAAEDRIGAPRDLIVRQMWQESRFDPKAHNAGSNASGIMQIVPRWHPDADVWNPLAAIDYGAAYLGQLYRQFGTWELALKAYNWGPGNVQKWQAGQLTQPTETLNYSAQILADIGGAGVTV